MKSIAEVRAELTAPGGMFEVGEADVNGVTTRVWKSAPPTLRGVLDLSSLHGPKDFMVFEDERISFGDHYRLAATFARRLSEQGVVKGDRVAIAMRNFPEWVIAFWGTVTAGAIVVPLNAWWKTGELVYGLADSGATVLVADDDRAAMLRDHLGETAVRQVIVARSESPVVGDEVAWPDFMGEIDPTATPPDVALEPDDDATIFYTSGTTGNPKGALGTHRNICTTMMSSAFGALTGAMRKSEVEGSEAAGDLASAAAEQCTLVSVPFFHVTGCHGFMLSSLAFGIKMVLMYKWDPERALQLIERERITTVGGVPSMVAQLLDCEKFDAYDTSSIQMLSYGGAPAPPELVRRIAQFLPGRTPSNGWGMTETSATFTSNSGPDYQAKPDSVGLPVPVGEVRIVDDAGSSVAVGETGELWVRGPMVIKGYWQRPDANAETFTDGWLHTGDIAKLDDEGFVYIVDRAKDVVIRGGENVYCAEVEAVLHEHPDVTDCAVIGVPHDVLGEEVGAVIVPRRGAALDAAAVTAHVKDRLAGFKAPTHIWIRAEELPRNAAGKILKRDLKDEVLGSA